MEVGTSVDPKDVNKKADIFVLCDDWIRFLNGPVVGYASILFLHSLALQGGIFQAVYRDRLFSVV